LTIRGGVNRRGRLYGGKQAALRRVATLFARCADPSEVSSAPAQEMAECLHVQNAVVTRYDDAVVTLRALRSIPIRKVVADGWVVRSEDECAAGADHHVWIPLAGKVSMLWFSVLMTAIDPS
jgi:hypothetical protein